jgi:two-component system, response regulator YesN
MTLLIADDEELIRFTVRDMIAEFPFTFDRVLEASNGTELMKLFREESPRIVLTDIRMPGLSGLDALENLGEEREESIWILLTGYSDFEYARKALKLNVLDYLLKPPSPDELQKTLEEARSRIEEYERIRGERDEQEGRDGPLPGNKGALLAEQAKNIAEEQYDREIGIAQVAFMLQVTPNYLSAVFHNHTGMKFTRYLTDLRLEKAKKLLAESSLTVKEIAGRVGYGSGRYFSGLFRQETGISPTDYMKRYRS